MQKRISIIFFYFYLLTSFITYGQSPVNDNCNNASNILINQNGYNIGIVTSDTIDITFATLQTNEFIPLGFRNFNISDKSIWYKFTLPTNRSVRVSLKQPTINISSGDVGFAVYKTNNCLPTINNISSKITPLATFGNSFHPCLEAGTYMIQVVGKLIADGKVFIELEIGSPTDSFDYFSNPGEFGILNDGFNIKNINIACQSLEGNYELCNSLKFPSNTNYNKSLWFTFQTPNYFDFVDFLLAKNSNTLGTDNKNIVGFSLYEGDVSIVGISNLIPIIECDTFRLNSNLVSKKKNSCSDLNTNTKYTVKLLFAEDFIEEVKFAIVKKGSQKTKGSIPIYDSLHIDNKLGIVDNSIINVIDYLGCNSKMSNNCPILPINGFLHSNVRYNLATHFTFNISRPQNLNISLSDWNGCSKKIVRIFKTDITTSCTNINSNSLVRILTSNSLLPCLDSGNYLIQVLSNDIGNNNIHFGEIASNEVYCARGSLGDSINLSLRLENVHAENIFDLSTINSYDNINSGLPLNYFTNYLSASDTFGCQNTLRVQDSINCGTNQKSIFRQFNISDSSFIEVSNLNGLTPNRRKINYVLYKGNASNLSFIQNVNQYPQLISGLDRITNCITERNNIPLNACLTPGTYTLVSLADTNMVNLVDAPNIMLKPESSSLGLNNLTARNLGSILDSPYTHLLNIDTFSCNNNAISINGVPPCKPKAIYREFYLRSPKMLRIKTLNSNTALQLFKGQISQSNNLNLIWSCFTDKVSEQCQQLPEGWYTIIDYADGFTYENNSNIGTSFALKESSVSIQIIEQCRNSPKFNRPYKASYASNNRPHIITWDTTVNNNVLYPKFQKTYQLPQEFFDCTIDYGNIDNILFNCDSHNRVALYVIEVKKESYLRFENLTQNASLYYGNIRQDSLAIYNSSPLQSCVSDSSKIEICKIQPGYYTLVIYANDEDICSNVRPLIIVDKVGNSRFDHAINAYDFGILSGDGIFINGKNNDLHPINSQLAPSNDFVYCTTGSKLLDPTEGACNTFLNSNVYNVNDTNNVMFPSNSVYKPIRRNLWYTFQTNKSGAVTINIDIKQANLSSEKMIFSVYKSNRNTNIPFSQLVSNNLVDSTIAQGLIFVTNNISDNIQCHRQNDLVFNISSCENPNARYYILVDLPSDLNINQQIEVNIKQDSIPQVNTLFDFYSTAGNIGTINADTIYTGPVDNFSCATSNNVYPSVLPNCDKKTIWYKFTIANNVSGNINIKTFIDSLYSFQHSNDPNSLFLYREVISGDSTSNGLMLIPLERIMLNNEIAAIACVSSGVYYIVYTGCNMLNQYVYPQLIINSSEGDYCFNAATIPLFGIGSGSTTVNVDCHTIGSDYGEFNPLLTCPQGALTNNYKSTWFKIDIIGSDTVDVTTNLITNTNVNPSNIVYRMMTGDCNAMQDQSCVTDALTQNTYECMLPGRSYYFQVLSPINTKGSISFSVNAVKRIGNCSPMTNCLKNANFVYQFDCGINDSVFFTNNSTYGRFIEYLWDFGYNNQTSTEINPKFKYPATNSTVIYQVNLRVVNTSCNDTAYYSLPVSIGPRPSVNLGSDTIICGQSNYLLQAPSFNGVNYIWNDNSTNSSLNVTTSGLYYVSLDYNGCEARDSIQINLSSLIKNNTLNLVLCTDTSNFTLNATRNLNHVSYRWNTSDTTSSIFVMNPGIYWVDIYHDSCSVRDSFIVTKFNNNISVLGNDSLVCNLQGSYTLNATLSGATSYLWNTNATTPSINVNSSGIYTVNIQVGNCVLQDTVSIIIARDTTIHFYDTLCYGDTFLRSNRQLVTSSGVYVDSFSTIAGCDSLIINHIQFRNQNEQTFNHIICDNQLPYIWNNLILDSSGIYTVTTTDRYGCDSISKLNLTINPTYLDSVKVVVCSNTLPFNFNNRQLTASGIYYDTLNSIYNCDSIIRLDFVVNPSTIDTIRDTICFNQTYTLPSSMVVNSTGIYIDSFMNSLGCDSIIYIELYVFPNKSITLYDSICNNQVPYVWNGQNLSSSGIYTYTRIDMNGCDSVTTLNLVVSDAYTRILYDTICASALPYLFNNRSLLTTGIYVDSFVSISGCDSIVTLNLLVNPIYIDTIFDTICYNQTYTLPSNIVVNSSGIYTSILRTINNCDSIIYTQLYVHSNKSYTLVDSICRNQIPYIWNGQNLSSSGIYSHTSIDMNGCDSVTTLNLVVSDVYSSILYDTICASALPYLFNNRSLQTSGTYVDSFVSSAGCDSIITLNLLVNPIYVDTIFDTICYSQTYTLPSNLMVNSNGIYTSFLTSVNNCDSIVVVNLYVHPNKSTTLFDTICSNQIPYIWNGQNLSSSGNYTYTSIDVNGCDSITSLQLIVYPNITTNISQSVCVEDLPYIFNGQNLFIPGIYRDTLIDRNGCDSFIILNFSVLPNTRDTIRIAQCYGGQYWFVDTMITTTGIFAKYLTNVHGCDSVLVLDITIHPQTPLPLVTTPIGYCEGAPAVAVSATGQNLTWYDAIQGGNVLPRAPIPNTNVVGVTTYYVSQRINNCESDRAAIQIFVSPKPNIVLDAQSVICNNDSVLVTVNGANNRTLEYRWNFNGASSRQVNNESYVVKWSSYGPKHIWVVPIDNGCVGDTAHITIDVKQSPLQPTFEVPSVVCQGEMIVAYAPNLYHAEYEWSVDDVPYGNHDTIRINTQTRAGNYKIRLVSKIEHCYSDPIEKVVFVSELPDATIVTDETIVCINDTFYLNAGTNLSDLQYNWHSNNVFLDNSENTPNAIVIMKYTEPVYLTVKNEYECAVTDSILLHTQHCCDLWVPNAFSPNGDGLNDEYRIFAKTNQKIKDFSIYDRYGKRVFYSVNQNIVWDGLVNGKKADLNVYYYIIQYICSDGKEYTLKGDITLIN